MPTFSIMGKGLKMDTAADIAPHLQALRAMNQVEEVQFGGNTLGVEACQALADVLKMLPALKVADLSDIFTGRLITEIPPSLSALCDALQDSTTLIELNLSDNAFGGRSAEPMVPFLTNNRSLQVLKLSNNGLGPAGGTVVATAILESAKLSAAAGRPSTLRSIICGRNRLENGSAPVWAEAFAAHGSLVEIRLPQNGIRAAGVTAIVNGLTHCRNLRILDLQDNTLVERDVDAGPGGPCGTRAIAAALPSWPALEVLNLSDCLLGAREGISLSLALGKGAAKKLTQLQLQYGELDHRAINILARAIADHMPDLTHLELNGNRADPEDECIQNIRDALESHGHTGALDELDDMEEGDVDDESVGGAVKDSDDEPSSAPPQPDEADELAGLMGKVSLGA